MYLLSRIPDKRYYQYSLEHKNPDEAGSDIYVIRDGQRLKYSDIAILEVWLYNSKNSW